ncbi:carbohydrate ABC transporter permease [Demequina lutea]|uniref:Raffinose/stachyose/melibiose transport system permease protein n=1 Tax=Demequina lutea TaxID=431489 RepID=A0A7Y9ZDZ2_9MICO|nr:carbohydrate ABC transporter permease [Demequina lutea]NYI42813.1 raffinose/stachyose/melibiose transport system permease protein [Demequina lutea]
MKKLKGRHVMLSVFMFGAVVVVGFPLYYIVVNTFKTQRETVANPLGLPTSLYLGNYIDVFESVPLVQVFSNTLYVTVLAIVLQLLVGSMAAYSMIMRHTLLNRVLGVVLLIAFVVPAQSTLIPLYRVFVGFKLVDNLNGLVILYAAGSVFCYFIIQGYMKTLPYEIIEAARIDGASASQIYWRVVLPLIRPILVTVGVFQTMWVWNDFVFPTVFISSPDKQTIVLQIYAAVGEFATNWPAFMTLTVIALIPMVVFFVFAQRHIVSGLVSGSVKG